jgi:Protein of unknown function (DUF2786)
MSVNADLIARIRKILARTEEAGCTTAEAEAAYGLAASLMAKHNLDMEEIEQAAGLDGEGWTEAEGIEAGRWSSVFDMAASVCCNFFFVQPFRTGRVNSDGKYREVQMFFGSPTNVETARFIFVSLLGAIDRIWKDHYRRGLYARTDRRAFALGVVEGYSMKLAAERAAMVQERDEVAGQPGTALALQTIRDKTVAALDAAYPDMETDNRRTRIDGSHEAHAAGHEAGRNLNLSRPLDSPGAPLGLHDRTRGR